MLLLVAPLIPACSMLPGGFSATDSVVSRRAMEKPAVAVKRAAFVGKASWYGPGFIGKKTASGHVFDDNKFTAAHKTLPFGTKAKVTNLDNGKSVNVEINDRGPFVEDRIIDLSQAAAGALGIIDRGVALVRIELVPEEAVQSSRVD